MSVRRRAVRERVERNRKWKEGWDDFGLELDLMQQVIAQAIAEGRKTMSPELFGQRLEELRKSSPKKGT